MFEHNYTSSSKCFANRDEVLRTDQPNKFSKLYDLSSHRYRIGGKYTYLLSYPNEKKHVVWSQTKSIIEQTDAEAVSGLDIIVSSVSSSFSGLCRTVPTSLHYVDTFIEGNCKTIYWYFSIGMLCSHKEWTELDNFPGNDGGTKRVILWAQTKISELIICPDSQKTPIDLGNLWKYILVFNAS